jgi:hypothetical protein
MMERGVDYCGWWRWRGVELGFLGCCRGGDGDFLWDIEEVGGGGGKGGQWGGKGAVSTAGGHYRKTMNFHKPN